MATNLAKFNTELQAASKRIHGDFQKFHRQVCLECLTRIVMRTAVDTGRARGNWQVGIGDPVFGELDVKGTKDQMTSLALKSGEMKLKNIPPFSLVHLTNNIEYVYYLEYVRTSPQHKEGMVEITLTEMAVWLSGI